MKSDSWLWIISGLQTAVLIAIAGVFWVQGGKIDTLCSDFTGFRKRRAVTQGKQDTVNWAVKKHGRHGDLILSYIHDEIEATGQQLDWPSMTFP